MGPESEMVKRLDEKAGPDVSPLADHIGWLLWNATEGWLDRFVSEMQAAGHDWFGRPQARLMGHLSRQGIRQSELTESSGLTKQAVQQTLDELEARGIVRREPDPEDRRGRVVRYTRVGVAALVDADRIKRKIERAAIGKMTAKEAARLRADLVDLVKRLRES
jgi:DNA-binding MarR family transcriptional regulator